MHTLLSGLWIVLVLGCGSSSPSRGEPVVAEAERSSGADEPRERRLALAWEPGSERIDVSGLGVAFRIAAPLTRFADDEIGTAACGDVLAHVSVVDRRTFVPSDAVLLSAFARAGCEVPSELTIDDLVIDGEELTARMFFPSGEAAGEWTVRAMTLQRAHRVVVVVSAVRVTDAATPTTFERIADAPGLEGISGETAASRTEDGDRTVEIVLGVLAAVAQAASPSARLAPPPVRGAPPP